MKPELTNEQLAEMRRRNQDLFVLRWGGDFVQHEAQAMWLGPSPSGDLIGFMFTLADGTTWRFAISCWNIEAFVEELMVAAATCVERTDAERAKSEKH